MGRTNIVRVRDGGPAQTHDTVAGTPAPPQHRAAGPDAATRVGYSPTVTSGHRLSGPFRPGAG
jgi:hypothetical protein